MTWDWHAVLIAAGKVLGAAVVGAGTGFQATGTWQGAAAAAAMAVGGLLIKRPTLSTP